MKITVAGIGILENFLNSTGIKIDIKEPATVESLIVILRERWGEEFYSTIASGRTLKPHVIVLLNGLSINMKQGLETELKEGDRIVFTIMFSGG